MNTKRLVLLGLLTALALILHIVENWLAIPAGVPGIKLGLANSVGLFAVNVLGVRSALYITITRIVLGTLLSGAFLGPAFLLSMAGGIGSILVMGHACAHWKPPFSLIGVSVTGAVMHSTLQVLAAAFIVSSFSLLWYIPYVVLFAVPVGMVTGFGSMYFLDRMPVPREANR